MAPSQPIATLRDVSRSFGGRTVLSGVELQIARGEFVVLVGRSGCGKSSLLKIIAGLDRGASGSVEVRAQRAVVFQDPRLLPWRRVWRNVTFGLRGPKRVLQPKALAALAEVGLTEQAEAWPATLSGGEAQRAALARALVRQPELLLMDEPFAALDALTRLRMQQLVLNLWRGLGLAALFVTHDVDEALLLADRILLMDEGRIAAEHHVDIPRPRARDNPRFIALHRELLAGLGVHAHRPAALKPVLQGAVT